MRRFPLFVLWLLVPLVTATCVVGLETPSIAATKPKTHMVLELDWVPNPDHSALYYSLEKGYFARAGLTVSFHVPSTTTTPDKLVALNDVTLAVSYEDLQFFAQADKLDDIAVWAMVPRPLDSIIVPAKEHVKTVSQLKGLTIGQTGTVVTRAILDYLRASRGWTKTELKTVNVGSSLLQSVLAGKVNAIIGTYPNVGGIEIAEKQHATPTVFTVTKLGVPTDDELVIIANSKKLVSDPSYAASVKQFVTALASATRAAQAHPKADTLIMEKETAYTKTFLKKSVPLTLKLMTQPDGAKLGCMDIADWQHFGNWLKRQRLITDRPDARPLMTNRYIPYKC